MKKTEKGFAMVLALVLLLAMSLMGGALILISSSDHQSLYLCGDTAIDCDHLAGHCQMRDPNPLISEVACMRKLESHGSAHKCERLTGWQ